MTDIVYLSQLSAAASVSGTDLLAITQGSTGAGTGTTRKVTISQLGGAFSSPADIRNYGAIADGQKAILLASVPVGSNILTVAMPPVWAASTTYAVGATVLNNGNAYNCTVAGTSGTTGPNAFTVTGAPQMDGTAGWGYLGAAPTTANVFTITDIGKSLMALRLDVVNGWCPWYQTTSGYTSVPRIMAVLSGSQVQISRAGDVAPPGSPTFPNMSWPYASTPSVIMWGTDNSPAIQTALNKGGEVVIPAGNWCVCSSLVTNSNNTVRGQGVASMLYPLGVLSALTGVSNGGNVFANAAYRDKWLKYEDTAKSMPDFYGAMALDGNQDITVKDLAIDMALSGLAIGGSTAETFLATRVTFSNVKVFGTFLSTVIGPNFTACDGVTVTDNHYINVSYCFEPWGGTRNVRYSRNYCAIPKVNLVSGVTYGGARTDPANGCWINQVGTNLNDDQAGPNLSVTDNVVYINGAVAAAAPSVGLGIFPDGNGSAFRNWEIRSNKVFYSGDNNWPIAVIGGNTNGVIFGNLIDGTAANSHTESAIKITPETGNNASASAISGVATSAGSKLVTLTWPAHGFTSKSLAAQIAWFYAVTGPTLGGIAVNGYFRISSVPDTNTIVFSAQAAASSTASSAWNGAFAQVLQFGIGVSVECNRLINCSAPSVSALIQLNGVGMVARGNSAVITNGMSPGYRSLIYFGNLNNESPGAALLNVGPTGTGSLGGNGGNNRVSWNAYEPAPVVLDIDDVAGILSVPNAVVFSATGPATVPITVSASPFSYVAPARGQVIVSNGTVSIVALNRGASSLNVGFTSGTVGVAPGDTIIVTYTVAPTMNFVGF